jgi:hypothetical protein
MMERIFFRLTTRSVKLMAFELAIKMALPFVFGRTSNSRPEMVV